MKSKPVPQPKTRKIFDSLLAVGIVVAILYALVWIIFLRNYAEEVARPLEKTLVANGAIKACTFGDAGKGPDNKQPWYEARFQLNVGKEDAERIIQKIATEHGFTLKHSDSPYEHIEWYDDKGSKDSVYSDLENGKIKLGFNIYNDTNASAITCYNGPALKGDANHTAVSLSINLPLRK